MIFLVEVDIQTASHREQNEQH